MKRWITRSGLAAFVMALLLLSGLPGGVMRTNAAPPAAVTGTPTEPATPTFTAVPPPPTATATAGSTAMPTDTPPPTATSTPKPPPTEQIVADPAITKSASVAEARVGDEITFTIVVTNRGNRTANDVVVTDSLPDYLDLLDATASRGSLTVSGRTVTVDIGSVAPGEQITLRIRARVNERAQPPSGRNGVSLTTSSSTDDPSNNSAEVTFAILGGSGATATPEEASPAATPAPTDLPPTAAPVPRNLPRTGGEDASARLPILAALGLAALALSMLLRRRARQR
ncbi:MAG: DUF11 domain-containing protein [Kouleothrix sp.]|nr:DUF11 domain-containing protein [Kouleothrix sp.]